MHEHEDREDGDGVTLVVVCPCGAEFLWRVGQEPEDPRCPACRANVVPVAHPS